VASGTSSCTHTPVCRCQSRRPSAWTPTGVAPAIAELTSRRGAHDSALWPPMPHPPSLHPRRLQFLLEFILILGVQTRLQPVMPLLRDFIAERCSALHSPHCTNSYTGLSQASQCCRRSRKSVPKAHAGVSRAVCRRPAQAAFAQAQRPLRARWKKWPRRGKQWLVLGVHGLGAQIEEVQGASRAWAPHPARPMLANSERRRACWIKAERHWQTRGSAASATKRSWGDSLLRVATSGSGDGLVGNASGRGGTWRCP